ncbi:hypothetical protein PHET_08114 [Paragonimus heterotremus]|uniref:PRMT5 oligomerisation domain-containing protein n=1 Tax=Paragonimus heterotremus TaxID=100268 RepID=A0A8J4TEQ5_9TREM|nr:hypothetical protein PHET_08114 [Paragonimus heterotremus]
MDSPTQFYSETKRSRNSVSSAQETPHVVRLLNCKMLAEPKEVFTFRHPKPDPKQSNSRSTTCSFLREHDTVVHGLAGYFETKLFCDVMLSIHPRRHSPQMVSGSPWLSPGSPNICACG